MVHRHAKAGGAIRGFSSLPGANPGMMKLKETDWAGIWFSFLPEYGEHPFIPYGFQEEGQDGVEWRELSHETFDGVGGFAHLLREKKIAFGPLPLLRESRPPAYFHTLRKLYGIELFPASIPYEWDVTYQEQPYQIHHPQHHSFDKETTQQITETAAATRISTNSLLLYCLDRAALCLLKNRPVQSKWMIPTNMRGRTHVRQDTANQASYICSEIPAQSSAADIHRLIKGQFARDVHWHNWRLLNIGRILGRAAIKYLYQKQYLTGPAWTGVFSNLGNWSLAQDHSWYFTPPVTQGCPVGAGAITINGRLHLSLQTHHGWQDNSTHARNILDTWTSMITREIQSDQSQPRPIP